ncbi:MAG: NAD-dependent epimerase/dehydratase family protein [Gemmatimonadales bacterium]
MTLRVLVTGGAGFIGSHVAEAHLAAGDEVTVLDDLSSGRRDQVPAGARFVLGDVRSAEARALVAGGGFTVLNHQAAQMDVRRSVAEPSFDASVNVLGLLNLLEGARAGGVRRVVFASSGGTVYGDGASRPTDEAAPKLPASPYGVAKLAAEYYLVTYGRLFGLESVALRYANVYGPHQSAAGEAGVVAIFGRQLLAGEPVTIFGDGEQTRDFVYVADVAAANLAAAGWAAPPLRDVDSRALNIGTAVATSVNGLVGQLAEVAGRRPSARHAPERAGELRHSQLAVGKVARELNWRPSTALAAGLRATLDWLAGDTGASPRKAGIIPA